MKNFLRAIIFLAGTALGPGMVMIVFSIMRHYFSSDPSLLLPSWATMLIYAMSVIIFGIIFFFISKRIVGGVTGFTAWIEKKSAAVPGKIFAAGFAGGLLGLLAGYFFSAIISDIPIAWIKVPLSVIIYVLSIYIFVRVGLICGRKLFSRKKDADSASAKPNVLDSSAIIDGRILDVLMTGVIEGRIIIPSFVLDELRHIADSADDLKRSRGRRGLDILGRIQKEPELEVEVSAVDYEDVAEVDAKLLRLADDEGARIITTDFNLNKVAAVKGVKVFNINDLANAVKPVLVAGEKLSVTVIKEGKDPSQGVGYLEDGTMIVVENGRRYIGDTVNAEVTSILQTSAGRMIFAKPV